MKALTQKNLSLLQVIIGFSTFYCWSHEFSIEVARSAQRVSIFQSQGFEFFGTPLGLLLVAEIVALLGFAFWNQGDKNKHPYHVSHPIQVGLCCAIIPTLILICDSSLPIGFLLAGFLALGVIKAVSTLVWMYALSTLGYRSLLTILPASVLAGYALEQVIPHHTGALVGANIVLSLVSFSILSKMNLEDNQPAFLQESVSHTWSFPVRPVILMTLYACAMLVVSHSYPDQELDQVFSSLGGVLGASLVIGVALLSKGDFELRRLYGIALPLVCFGLLGTLSCFPVYQEVTSVICKSGFIIFSLFTTLLLANISYRYGVSPFWIFGITRAARVAVMAIFMAVIGPAGLTPVQTDWAAGAVICVCIVVSITLLTPSDYESAWGIKPKLLDVSSSHMAIKPQVTFDDKCARIARLFALTHREEEVMKLLIEGKTGTDVQGVLCISKGTVKNHITHIYKKLDIHTRQELKELFESHSEK